MKYARWPVGTRAREVPGLAIERELVREHQQRRAHYLSFAYPAYLSKRN